MANREPHYILAWTYDTRPPHISVPVDGWIAWELMCLAVREQRTISVRELHGIRMVGWHPLTGLFKRLDPAAHRKD